MWSRSRARLTYANVMATAAMFIALGGGAYAAVKLPANSVGTRQLKRDAVNSSRVRDGSLRAKDFERGQVPAAVPGTPGSKGDPGPAGPHGAAGPRGPGALSFDGQVEKDATFHAVATVDGLVLQVFCNDASSNVQMRIGGVDPGKAFYAWGTAVSVGVLGPASLAGGAPDYAYVSGPGVVNLDVTATADRAAAPVRYTRIDASVVRGVKCDYHALVIPSQ